MGKRGEVDFRSSDTERTIYTPYIVNSIHVSWTFRVNPCQCYIFTLVLILTSHNIAFVLRADIITNLVISSSSITIGGAKTLKSELPIIHQQ